MPGDKRVAGYGNTIPYEAAYFVPACAPPRTRSGTWRRVTVPDAVSIGKSCYGTAREAALGLSWRHVPRHACCSPHGQPETPAKAIAARVEGDAHDGQVDTGAAFRLPLDYRTQLSHLGPECLNLAGALAAVPTVRPVRPVADRRGAGLDTRHAPHWFPPNWFPPNVFRPASAGPLTSRVYGRWQTVTAGSSRDRSRTIVSFGAGTTSTLTSLNSSSRRSAISSAAAADSARAARHAPAVLPQGAPVRRRTGTAAALPHFSAGARRRPCAGAANRSARSPR